MKFVEKYAYKSEKYSVEEMIEKRIDGHAYDNTGQIESLESKIDVMIILLGKITRHLPNQAILNIADEAGFKLCKENEE